MPKHNSKSDKPAKKRYHDQNHLKKNKIARMVKHNKISEEEAEKIFNSRKRKAK
jgi:hypothetical protein